MVILLIGPSNVGKTTYGEAVSRQLSNCEFHDLDKLISEKHNTRASQLLVQVKNDKFAEYSFDIVKNLDESSEGKLFLIAIGAGTLQSLQTIDRLKNFTTIAVLASAEEVCRRDRLKRPLNEFSETEFSDYRKQIYKSADYNLDVTGQSLEQATDGLLKLLQETILPKYQEKL